MSVETKVAFTSYEIKDCLFDTERTLNLQKAINATVKEGDIVLEAGGGTGVLSMFALKAGAKHVYVVEFSARFTNIIREVAKRNGFEDRITVINGDATETDVPEGIDVYISELLCTGLFNEPQLQAYNNLSRFFKPTVACIPQQVKSYISFAQGDSLVYGIDFACDSYVAKDIKHMTVTDRDCYMDIVFDGSPVETVIDLRGEVEPTGAGNINCAIFESEAMLSHDVHAGPTKFLFNPELLFFKNTSVFNKETECDDMRVDYNRNVVDYELNYEAGCDTLDVNLRVF